MPDLEIKISTPAELEGLKQTEKRLEIAIGRAKGLGEAYGDLEKKLGRVREMISASEVEQRKLASTEDQLGNKTTDLTSKKARLLQGLQKLGSEFPLVGAAVNALKNPFALISTAAIALMAILQKFARDQEGLRTEFDKTNTTAKVASVAFVDVAKSLDVVVTGMKSLQEYLGQVNKGMDDQIQKIGETIDAQGRLLEAEAELEKQRIDLNEKNPVMRERRKAEVDNVLGERLLGLRGSKPGQQAQVVEAQIEKEKAFQRDVAEELPREEDLRQAVAARDAAKVTADRLASKSRQQFTESERLRMLGGIEPGKDEDQQIQSLFGRSDISRFIQEGAIREVKQPGGFRWEVDREKVKQMSSGASAQFQLTKEKADQAAAAYRSSAAVAARSGVNSEADIPRVISESEAAAAGMMNESYRRQQSLEGRRAALLREQGDTVAIEKVRVQTTKLRGEGAVGNAEDAWQKTTSGKSQAEVDRAVKEALAEQAKQFAEGLRENAITIGNTNRILKTLSQNSGR